MTSTWPTTSSVSPVITEKSTLVSEANQVIFKVAREATKTEIKAAVEKPLQGQGEGRQHARPQGQAEDLPRRPRAAERCQEGHRHPRRRPLDRRHDGPLRKRTMALKTFRPTSPGLRQLVLVDRSQLWKGAPVKMLVEGKSSRAAATTTAASRRATSAAATSSPIASSTSAAASTTSPARSSGSSTIPTAPRSSRCIKYQDGELCLHPGAAALGGRRQGRRGRQGRREARQRHAAGRHADRHHRAQRRAEARRRRPDRALGRRLRAARRPRRRLGDAELNSGETRRVRAECMATVGAVSNPDHSNEVTGKAGRTRWKGTSPDRALDRHEPDRPSQRRPHQGRQALGDAVGQADQGRQDAQEQGDRQVHHPWPSAKKK